jgi:hypothetical protein
MAKKIIISILSILVIFSSILSIKKNKAIKNAFTIIEKNENTQIDLEKENFALKEVYFYQINLPDLYIDGAFLDSNNNKVPIQDAIKFNQTVAFFISDSACLDCHREYISLLFKYFYKEAVIIRLGPLLDHQEFLQYRIWGLTGCKELENIIDSKKPMIALINSNKCLKNIFIPAYYDLAYFEKYLLRLKKEIAKLEAN